MGAALQLIIIPVLLLIAVLSMAVFADFSLGAVLLGVLLLGVLLTAAVRLLRLEWQIEEEEGVHEHENEHPTRQQPLQAKK